MQVIPQHRAEVVTQLAASLKAAGLSTQVIADESSETSQYSHRVLHPQISLSDNAPGNYQNDEPVWLNASVGESLGGNCHHLYDFASATTQQTVFEAGRNLSGGVPTWFTEICCGSNMSDQDVFAFDELDRLPCRGFQ